MPTFMLSTIQSLGLASYPRVIVALASFASVAVLYMRKGRKNSPCSSFPAINSSATEYLALGRKLLVKAERELPDKPFRVLTGGGAPLVILPPRFADEVARDSRRMSPREMLRGFWQAHLPGFEPFRLAASEFIHEVIKSRLTQRDLCTRLLGPLADEADAAVSDLLQGSDGAHGEWCEILLSRKMSKCVARVTTLAFLGPELCRNQEWARIVTDYPLKGLAAGRVLRRWPEALRPVVHWFLPCCRELRELVATAREVVDGILRKRHEEDNSKKAVEQNNALSWMEQLGATIVERRSKGLKNRIDEVDGLGMEHTGAAEQQLGLAVLANASSTDILSQVLINICRHPELIQPLREEFDRETRDGWKVTTPYNLKLMDSVLKETMRLKPIGTVLLGRRVLENGVVLSNRVAIPKDTHIAVSCEIMRDPNVYPDPDTFNGYRWLEKRNQDDYESAGQMASTSREFLSFGLGTYACPGRFMAATTLKLLLGSILLKYHVKTGPSVNSSDLDVMEFGFTTMANPRAKIMMKRRRGGGGCCLRKDPWAIMLQTTRGI